MASRLGNGKVRKDQTDHYGRIKEGGGAKITDFQDSDSVTWDVDEETGKIFAESEGVLADAFLDTFYYIRSGKIYPKNQYTVAPDGGLASGLMEQQLRICVCTQNEYNSSPKHSTILYILKD